MVMIIKRVILKSTVKEKLGQFLSQLFEMEFAHQHDDVVLRHDSGMSFILEDALEESIECQTVVDLTFNHIDDLHDLIQKIRFLEYRGFSGIKLTDMHCQGHQHYFEFTDFDQRTWRLSAHN